MTQVTLSSHESKSFLNAGHLVEDWWVYVGQVTLSLICYLLIRVAVIAIAHPAPSIVSYPTFVHITFVLKGVVVT